MTHVSTTPDADVRSKVRPQTAGAFTLAVIGGDGIGPEVVAEGLKVLDAVDGIGRLRTDQLRPRSQPLAADRRGAAGLGSG